MNVSMEAMAQLGTWLGIVSQLFTTRISKLLSAHNLTITQFAMLNHLARHQTDAHTISALTEAIEVNQPGATKIVKKFVEMGLVQVTKDRDDGRKRYVSITEQGLATVEQVLWSMAPDTARWLEAWDSAEIADFLAHLQKLGGWLDANRLETD